MRNLSKSCENLWKLLNICKTYINMYIVYFFKKFRTLWNFVKYFEILQNIAKYCENNQILNSGLHCFIWLFRNISQYISKYFEIYFKIVRKKCMPKSFERLRIFRKISHRSQFFRKISVCNFFWKISYIYFADVNKKYEAIF